MNDVTDGNTNASDDVQEDADSEEAEGDGEDEGEYE